MTKTVALGIGLVTVLYFVISISSIVLFGDALEAANANLMNNINQMYKLDKSPSIFFVSSVLRLVFSTILFFHVPFTFFMAKDSLLLCLDELDRKTTSKAISEEIIQDDAINVQSTGNSYDDMNQRTYYLATSVLILIQIIGSCTIKFIKQIVPWTSIVSTNCIEFLFPSTFYLVSAMRYPDHPLSQSRVKKFFEY